jgi:hypothetical protein
VLFLEEEEQIFLPKGGEKPLDLSMGCFSLLQIWKIQQKALKNGAGLQ